MRVVSGLYRHRELLMPKGDNTRPSKDMVKEAFFSAINEKCNNAVVLDLFAGSGALGIEALSRGAKFAYFIDNDKNAIEIIKKNVFNLKINNASILKSDYLSALNKFKEQKVSFDILLLDPPYKLDIYSEVINYLIDNKMLNKNAVCVLESDHNIDINLTCQKMKDYKYGKTLIKIIWL